MPDSGRPTIAMAARHGMHWISPGLQAGWASPALAA